MYTEWRCKLVQPFGRAVWSFLKKTKREFPYDPAILLLGIYKKKTKSLKNTNQKDTCITMFIAVLFTIAKTWKHPSAHQQMIGLRRCGIYIYDGIKPNHKKNGILPLEGK